MRFDRAGFELEAAVGALREGQLSAAYNILAGLVEATPEQAREYAKKRAERLIARNSKPKKLAQGTPTTVAPDSYPEYRLTGPKSR